MPSKRDDRALPLSFLNLFLFSSLHI
jgi:hypothetical protein